MLLISAVIQPFMLDDVRAALTDLGCHGMTVSEVQGFGMQKSHSEVYRGATYTPDYVAKSKIEVLIHEQFVEQVIDAIVKSARTGKVGDGKIWVTRVEDAVRIRTGERGDQAL
ncbi:P-II family nitrogen regulator [Corynebacterium epidermidicanis]|uniref:Nitrogen regulatory protein P-II family n=1 Tax=Corynebacterium epidermidicanis TaxID=1050174 RepID=A0A0G3GX52_9CORY|nr:P-II family nitrogen regulator [Corynebacterium epidermidicanis]AKK03442.1 nitrogen regulatory protein P-II family [Corynebacterium epidermidicanis]